jgi:hypothetical protein
VSAATLKKAGFAGRPSSISNIHGWDGGATTRLTIQAITTTDDGNDVCNASARDASSSDGDTAGDATRSPPHYFR